MFNILVTDDEQIVIDSLSFIISKNFGNEAKVFTALSGTEAIEIVMKENIDIMFMDINIFLPLTAFNMPRRLLIWEPINTSQSL